MRFCKDGNQKIQDKVKEDKDEQNRAMFVFDEESKPAKKDPYARKQKQELEDTSNVFGF
jgi:hypothetical protein